MLEMGGELTSTVAGKAVLKHSGIPPYSVAMVRNRLNNVLDIKKVCRAIESTCPTITKVYPWESDGSDGGDTEESDSEDEEEDSSGGKQKKNSKAFLTRSSRPPTTT